MVLIEIKTRRRPVAGHPAMTCAADRDYWRIRAIGVDFACDGVDELRHLGYGHRHDGYTVWRLGFLAAPRKCVAPRRRHSIHCPFRFVNDVPGIDPRIVCIPR